MLISTSLYVTVGCVRYLSHVSDAIYLFMLYIWLAAFDNLEQLKHKNNVIVGADISIAVNFFYA